MIEEINYDELPVLLEPKELENVLKIDINLVYKIIKRSDFPTLRISKRHVTIPKVLLIKWIKNNKEFLKEHRKRTIKESTRVYKYALNC